jgi:hypothetical protein
MQYQTRQDTWAQYGRVSLSVQDGEGIRMAQGRFLRDMLDILLRCFGLLLLAVVGAAAIWEVFGVVGVIAWWFVLGVAALVLHYPPDGGDDGPRIRPDSRILPGAQPRLRLPLEAAPIYFLINRCLRITNTDGGFGGSGRMRMGGGCASEPAEAVNSSSSFVSFPKT